MYVGITSTICINRKKLGATTDTFDTRQHSKLVSMVPLFRSYRIFISQNIPKYLQHNFRVQKHKSINNIQLDHDKTYHSLLTSVEVKIIRKSKIH